MVLGQKNFDVVEINQGVYFPSASSLSMPYGVAATGEWLLVADTANSRLLGWKQPESILSLPGVVADGIAGQDTFQSKSYISLNHLRNLRFQDCDHYFLGVATVETFPSLE